MKASWVTPEEVHLTGHGHAPPFPHEQLSLPKFPFWCSPVQLREAPQAGLGSLPRLSSPATSLPRKLAVLLPLRFSRLHFLQKTDF